ncbi:uncharacterized protein LOC133795665 isoform X2 [Humulus lupulus]|uniref:uncharacterized protein LOC133795665 isoform X2 n=1 Tax=Humulus lupulus TaxID=3486 RepID=UPI002B41044A|nr:uncharacterized protein LOC133795665 isoform X2 [Humulus lupulus]
MDKSNTKSREKNKTKIGQCTITTGFGLGGLVVVGGALAVAGLAAVYAIRRYRKKGCTKTSEECFKFCPKKNEDHGGLQSLLETSSPTPLDSSSQSSNHETSDTSVLVTQEMINSTELEIPSEETLQLEEGEDAKIDRQSAEDEEDDELGYEVVNNSESSEGQFSMESKGEVIMPADDKTEEQTEKHTYFNKINVVFNNTVVQELKRTEEKIKELEMIGEEVRSYRLFVRILFMLIILLLLRFPLLLCPEFRLCSQLAAAGLFCY